MGDRAALHIPRSTVSAGLRRLGLNRPPATPPLPVQRYEWPAPGDLVHVDIKPLGRIGCIGHRMHGDRRRARQGSGGNMSTCRSMIKSRRLCRSAGRPARSHLCRLPRARGRVVFRAWDHRAARHQRQRQRVCVAAFRATCAASDSAIGGRGLHPAHQRQSRTFYSDAVTRVGVRRGRTPGHGSVAGRSDATCPTTIASGRTRASSISLPGHGSERCVMNNVFDFNN